MDQKGSAFKEQKGFSTMDQKGYSIEESLHKRFFNQGTFLPFPEATTRLFTRKITVQVV